MILFHKTYEDIIEACNFWFLSNPQNKASLRQMGVKVVKASGLGGRVCDGEAVEAYVVIEVDEPGQRYQTQPIRSRDPVWDQQFSV